MPTNRLMAAAGVTTAFFLLLGLPDLVQGQEATEPVAPAVAEAAAEPAPAAAAEVEQQVAQARSLANAGRSVEALGLLDEFLARLEAEEGTQSPLLVAPLLVRADIALGAGDVTAAGIAFQRALSIIEQIDGVFSASLVDPLVGLAAAYEAAGRHEEAVTLLRRARHITHRSLGILNMEQLEIAERLAENYFRQGMISDANRENRFAFRVNERQFGANSAELVPAINKLAAWYERIGAYSVARQYYRRSVDLLEDNFGEDDLRIADPLRRLARTYLKQDKALREAEASLQRAIDIYENSPGTDVVEHAGSLIELGDWLLVSRRRDKAMDAYREAWSMLTDNGAEPENALPVFGKPTRLRLAVPPADSSMFAGRKELFVDIQYSVTPEGVPRDVKVVGGNAHWTLKRAFRTAMHKARFRPRFADGDPVLTEGVMMRYTYQLRIEGEPATAAAAPVAESVDGVGD